MKVFKNGKEVKDATVVYGIAGEPSLVRIKGDANDYDAAAFTFKDTKTQTKTKDGDALTTDAVAPKKRRLFRKK